MSFVQFLATVLQWPLSSPTVTTYDKYAPDRLQSLSCRNHSQEHLSYMIHLQMQCPTRAQRVEILEVDVHRAQIPLGHFPIHENQRGV